MFVRSHRENHRPVDAHLAASDRWKSLSQPTLGSRSRDYAKPDILVMSRRMLTVRGTGLAVEADSDIPMRANFCGQPKIMHLALKKEEQTELMYVCASQLCGYLSFARYFFSFGLMKSKYDKVWFEDTFLCRILIVSFLAKAIL